MAAFNKALVEQIDRKLYDVGPEEVKNAVDLRSGIDGNTDFLNQSAALKVPHFLQETFTAGHEEIIGMVYQQSVQAILPQSFEGALEYVFEMQSLRFRYSFCFESRRFRYDIKSMSIREGGPENRFALAIQRSRIQQFNSSFDSEFKYPLHLIGRRFTISIGYAVIKSELCASESKFHCSRSFTF